jgi:hypothetical protein
MLGAGLVVVTVAVVKLEDCACTPAARKATKTTMALKSYSIIIL